MSRPRFPLVEDPVGLQALRAELLRFKTTPAGGLARLSRTPAHPPSMTDVTPLPDVTPPDTSPLPYVTPLPDVTLLVDRARAGDADAFGALYDRYNVMVYRYVYYRVGDRALAEDLVSETFLRALRRIGDFTWQGSDIGAWLITIARNLVLDHKKSSRSRLEVPVPDILADAPAGVTDSPEASVMDRATREVISAAIQALNPDQQECVILRFLEGLSVRETALAMGRNAGSIKALQYRAIRTLARHIPDGALD